VTPYQRFGGTCYIRLWDRSAGLFGRVQHRYIHGNTPSTGSASQPVQLVVLKKARVNVDFYCITAGIFFITSLSLACHLTLLQAHDGRFIWLGLYLEYAGSKILRHVAFSRIKDVVIQKTVIMQ
jgi:hypothetical protein